MNSADDTNVEKTKLQLEFQINISLMFSHQLKNSNSYFHTIFVALRGQRENFFPFYKGNGSPLHDVWQFAQIAANNV